MKALVISDDVKTLEFVEDILLKNGMDVINYKWLVKALDNIEEINPDLIVVNVLDYPRHWKTLAQFVKTIFLNKISICLFVPEGFSGGEMKKARTLEIDFCCHSQEEFEKCIHNFTQTKKTFLQNLKKIYSEKDDSSIISVTDLLQLLGTTFVTKSEDIKLHSARELFNRLEELGKQSKNAAPLEKSQPSQLIEQSETTEKPKNTIDVVEQKDGDIESGREIKNDESEAIASIATTPIEKTNEDDYTLPTVENLLESSSEECILPTAANLFAGVNSTENEQTEAAEQTEEEDLPATQCEAANSTDDYTLPTAENIAGENEVASAADTSSEASIENKSDDYTLPTVENLLESSSEECILPTAENLFAGVNSTENEQTETAEHAEKEDSSATKDETANSADDYTLPTVENIAGENEVVSTVDTSSEASIENKSDDYTLPSVENLLESSSEECILPTAENLFAGVNSTEGEQTEVAEQTEEEDLPATQCETANSADDYTLPTVENLLESSSEECILPTAANLFAGVNSTECEQTEAAEHAEKEDLSATQCETANSVDDYTLPTAENIAGENEVASAADTSSETPLKNESDKPLDAETNAPVEKSDESSEVDVAEESDVISSVDSKKHFGSLFRLIQEKYESK